MSGLIQALDLSTLVVGVLSGGLYALLALSIILIFRTTGVANFAQGELGTLSVFLLLFYILPTGMPVIPAWGLAILLAGIVSAIVYFILISPRPEAPHLNVTVRTLGLYMLLYAIAVFLWGGQEPYRVPSIFPSQSVNLGGVQVGYDQIGTLAVTAVAATVFLVLFRYTRLGLAMRAAAIDPTVAVLLGIDVRLIRLAAWVAAGMLGAIAALLIASSAFLETTMMRPYLFKAFTAAIMGGLTSFPGAIVGGLILGIADAFAVAGISIHMREPFTFAILLLTLLLRPAGLFGSVGRARV
jgi:branched-chain amino acid transport system permease protein